MEEQFNEVLERLKHCINNSKRFSFVNYGVEQITNYNSGKAIYIDFDRLIEFLENADEETQDYFINENIISLEYDDTNDYIW